MGRIPHGSATVRHEHREVLAVAHPHPHRPGNGVDASAPITASAVAVVPSAKPTVALPASCLPCTDARSAPCQMAVAQPAVQAGRPGGSRRSVQAGLTDQARAARRVRWRTGAGSTRHRAPTRSIPSPTPSCSSIRRPFGASDTPAPTSLSCCACSYAWGRRRMTHLDGTGELMT